MFLSCAKLFAPVALSLLLLPGTLAAQSLASIQPLAERQQKVLDALRNAKVKIPPGASMPTFLSLLPAMKEWAALPDDPSPEEMTKLHDLIGATFPSHLERLARFNQLKVEAQEQPRTVLAYPSATSSMTVPILNPDHVLFKYTVTSKASEFFPTTQDVADQIKAFTDAGGKTVDKSDAVLCKAPPDHASETELEKAAACLSKTRMRDILYRFASGYTGTFSYSDNPQVVQNILIPNGTPQSQQNRLFSGEVLFDPSNVFLTGTDWKNVSAAKAVYSQPLQKTVAAKVAKRCKGIDDDTKTYMPSTTCLAKLSGPTGWTRFAAAIMPTVDYKLQTQFDFIKSGANFIVPPYPLGHLYNFSFTQDLRRAVPTAKQREDAVAAIYAFTKGKKPPAASSGRMAVLDDFKRLVPDETRLIKDEWYFAFLDKIAPYL